MHINPILQQGGREERKLIIKSNLKFKKGIYVLSTILSKLLRVTMVYNILFVHDKQAFYQQQKIDI